ncbi:MAG: hypothetical protein V5B44_24400 [Candidatus Accumulibacter necessarius]|jgi:hypothetical protein
MNSTAPIGASKAQRLMPLAVMKLPMLHCATKGREQEQRQLDLAEDS